MEPKVFLIHGFEGSPNGGWRSSLMAKLALEDIYACSLPMPDPYTPTRDGWIEEIKHVVPIPNENIYLVGHSLGVPAILQYLKTLPEGVKIGGVVLVSGPYHNVDDGYKEKLKSFFEPAYDFEHYKKTCKNFVVIHGDNDGVVPFADAEEFSKALSCELVSIPNGGHLNGGSGWRELPAALDALMRFIKG
ncbi:MAG: serine hydrolase family protein [Candidatus Pacebacteria bacterium]|nr:serine hydrolase family protein [Candidatus Paceibacterota bacterium]